MPDARYEAYRLSSDFIREHIFPGGHLVSMGAMAEAARPFGLAVSAAADVGRDYACTLREWRGAWERPASRKELTANLGYPGLLLEEIPFLFRLLRSGVRRRVHPQLPGRFHESGGEDWGSWGRSGGGQSRRRRGRRRRQGVFVFSSFSRCFYFRPAASPRRPLLGRRRPGLCRVPGIPVRRAPPAHPRGPGLARRSDCLGARREGLRGERAPAR